jgi:hypothetical protein
MIVSPLAISKDSAENVQIVLDAKLASSTELLAFHHSDPMKTVFITAQQLKDHLSSTGVKVTEFDFVLTYVVNE